MLWREHNPPHFHAKYADDEVAIEIRTGRVIAGSMSPRALALVEEWRQLRIDELKRDWELADQKRSLFPIKPLE